MKSNATRTSFWDGSWKHHRNRESENSFKWWWNISHQHVFIVLFHPALDPALDQTAGTVCCFSEYRRCNNNPSSLPPLQQSTITKISPPASTVFFFFSVFRIITTITNDCDFQYTTRSVWGFTGAQVSGVLTGCMATRAGRQKKKFLTEVRAADRVDSEALIKF